MITELYFKNSYGDTKTLALREPELTGYIVKEITGLSPTDIDLKTTQLASGNKYIYNKGFRKIREINITIVFLEHNTSGKNVQVLREELMNLLKVNDYVTMGIKTDKPNGNLSYTARMVTGYVSSHVSDQFSEQCEAKIKITCPDIFIYQAELDSANNYSKKAISVACKRATTSSISINYDGTFPSDVILNLGYGDTAVQYLYGNFEASITNNDITKKFHVVIPQEEGYGLFKRMSCDFTSDIPIFEITDKDGHIIDGSQYVRYREIIRQGALMQIMPGTNAFDFAMTGTAVISLSRNELIYYTRYLGV